MGPTLFVFAGELDLLELNSLLQAGRLHFVTEALGPIKQRDLTRAKGVGLSHHDRYGGSKKTGRPAQASSTG